MNVQQTVAVVVTDTAARTPLAATNVKRTVPQDTRVMESTVWVSQLNIVTIRGGL